MTSTTHSGGRRPAVAAATVLDTAETLLDHDGFDGISVRRLADAVGVSRQVVYTHFGGMNGLLDALHERLSARLTAAVGAIDATPGTSDYLLAGAAAYRHAARRWPELYQLVFERPVPEYTIGADAAAAGLRSFEPIVTMASEWLQANGRTRARRAEAIDLARSMWSSLHGFIVLERVGFATEAETDRISQRAIEALLAGWISTTPGDL
ncbi:MAG: TetR/AcrR family transcriptional regulator [Actinomycetota bacterium]